MSGLETGERTWLAMLLVAALAVAATIVPAACGAASTDLVRPVYAATIEACRQRQDRALDRANTREEAVASIALVRRRCDVAYAGLDAVAGLLEEALPSSGAEDEVTP